MQEQSIKEILDEYGKYTSLTSGTSMWPMLHHQKDNIIVIKPEERLKKYDVALYEGNNGIYIMHRVCEVKDDHYVIIGDNLMTKEYVSDDRICGKLCGFYKNGKRYIDLDKNPLYKFYSRLWVALYPVRPAIIFIGRAIRYIQRKLFHMEYS